MHHRKSKKILIYFLLLLLVGSINNIELSNIKFSSILSIKIFGLGNENKDTLLENINSLELGNIFFIKKNKIKEIVENNNLVEKYDIFKIYPSSLYINIKKTNFLARANRNSTNYFIGSNGKLITNSLYSDYKDTPFIFGNPKIREFLNFKNVIDNSDIEYEKIKNLYYFPTGRWDLELKNNVLIKLPQKNIDKSLKLAFEFLTNDNLNQIKIIDARINNQIILND